MKKQEPRLFTEKVDIVSYLGFKIKKFEKKEKNKYKTKKQIENIKRKN